jgi:hypothetical protein
MGETINIYRILVGKLLGKVHLEKQKRRRMEDKIKMDIKDIATDYDRKWNWLWY